MHRKVAGTLLPVSTFCYDIFTGLCFGLKLSEKISCMHMIMHTQDKLFCLPSGVLNVIKHHSIICLLDCLLESCLQL